MRYLHLIWLYFRLSVLNELQYRANFFVELFQSGLNVVGGLAGLAIIFAQTRSLNGWSAEQLAAVMGIHILVGGVIKATIQPNMERLMHDIEQGTLDYTLTKPEDSQLLISIRQTRIWMLTDFVLGSIVVIAALGALGWQIGWLDVLAFAAALALGGCIVYAFWLILSCTAFWFVRVGNVLEIFQSMFQAGRWPASIYPDTMKFGLTFLVPIAFAVTVPAEALTRQLRDGMYGGYDLALAAALAVMFLILARVMWHVALRRYSGASA